MGCHAAAAAAVAVAEAAAVVMVFCGRRHYVVGGLKFHFTGLLTGHNSYAELAEFPTWHLSYSSHTSVLQPTCSVWVLFCYKIRVLRLVWVWKFITDYEWGDDCQLLHGCAFCCKVNQQSGNLCRHQSLLVCPVETRFKPRHGWEKFDRIRVMRGKTILLSHRLACYEHSMYRMGEGQDLNLHQLQVITS